jgi:hypothetical protein
MARQGAALSTPPSIGDFKSPFNVEPQINLERGNSKRYFCQQFFVSCNRGAA